jgi:predicted dehydrogenase
MQPSSTKGSGRSVAVVNAVLVGCGAMSKAWLEAAARTDGLTIAGLVDIDERRAEARAGEFGLASAVTGAELGAVLKRTAAEMVFDVVVPEARREVAHTAFSHGCHLLTEKPLADTREHAMAILAAAKRADRIHAVVQNRRYLANVRRIRRFLDSRAIGAPTSVHCDFFVAPHFGGFREEMRHVLLLDMAIHTFDAARYMIDCEPRAVYCQEWEPRNSWYRQGSSAIAVFEMSGGAIFAYRGSWCADGLRTSWESSWRVVGERGSLTWDGYDDLRAEVTTGERDGILEKPESVVVPPLDPRDRVGGHLGVIQDFVAAVRNGGKPETTGADNIKSFAMVLSAIESAEAGRRVEITI